MSEANKYPRAEFAPRAAICIVPTKASGEGVEASTPSFIPVSCRKEAQQQQQAAIEQQGQVNQQSTMVTEQAKQQTLQMEIQLKSELAKMERETQLKVLDRKYGYDIQLKQMEMQQKTEAADTAARAKIVDTALKNQTALQQTTIQAAQKQKASV